MQILNKRRARPVKSDKKLFSLLLALVLAAASCISTLAYARQYLYTMDFYPGTEDTVTNLPESQIDLNSDTAYSVPNIIPERKGYEFLYWTLDYDVAYNVTYAVNPDPVYGIPEDSRVPTDPTLYASGTEVTVAAQLTTTQDFGINAKTDEKRPGTWKFVPWNVEDFGETESFEINKDTTITGEWKFISKFKYSVHHLDIDTYDTLAPNEVYWLDELGEVEPKSKKPATEFYTQYQKSKYNPVTEKVYENKRKDFLLPGAVYSKNKTQYVITVTLTEDDQHIFFFYQRPGAG